MASQPPGVLDDGSSARASREAKRSRILEAARTVCARVGFEGARMDEIAAEARVSKGTLYNFFDRKEALLIAGLVAQYQQGTEELQDQVGEGTPGERLAQYLELLTELLPTISAEMMVNLQAWGLVAVDEVAREQLFSALRVQYQAQSEFLAKLIRQGQECGEFADEVEAGVLAEALLSLFDGQVYRSTFAPERANPDTLREQLQALLELKLLPRQSRAPSEVS
ncbi:MAG: TetR/AcrR family transcriptional regulator [Proteobacteria bacterium]|nr:TetR/AcrR family transcriptional regulator [Pseudomonadota bacterium]